MNSNATGDLWFARLQWFSVVRCVLCSATAPSLDNLWYDYITMSTAYWVRACGCWWKQTQTPKVLRWTVKEGCRFKMLCLHALITASAPELVLYHFLGGTSALKMLHHIPTSCMSLFDSECTKSLWLKSQKLIVPITCLCVCLLLCDVFGFKIVIHWGTLDFLLVHSAWKQL